MTGWLACPSSRLCGAEITDGANVAQTIAQAQQCVRCRVALESQASLHALSVLIKYSF
eukprot:COSAG01_NODE_6997_length_3399_cov_2.340000_6_plen_57_part_01